MEQINGSQPVQHLEDLQTERLTRWQTAQVAYRRERYDIARYHINRLMRTSTSPNDIDTLSRALVSIAAADPWAFNLGFSLKPSSNIKRYTYNDTFETSLGVFVPAGGGEAESGIGFDVATGLSYSFGLSDQSLLSVRANLNHTIYDDAELNKTQIFFAVSRDSYSVGHRTTLEPFVRLRYDGHQDLTRRDVGLDLSSSWWMGDGAQLTATALMERRSYFNSSYRNGPYSRLSVDYGFAPTSETYFSFGGDIARSVPEQSHLRYWEARLTANSRYRIEYVGTVGFFLNLSARTYDSIFPATNREREDKNVIAGVSFQPQGIEVFGARPQVECKSERNTSNIALYDFEAIDCGLSFKQSF
ncbi:surface lipoprotein assembly modifier [Thalassorhabdomicrobium marinisediminis]|nr:surface lipoprotein assembly modifier [Thalassorhabdomicrobium marinisediminis]